MKFLIVLAATISLISAGPGFGPVHYGYHGPAAPIGHDGRVVDTPEVAHAKAAHLAAVAEAASKASYSVPTYAEDESYEGYEQNDGYSGSLTKSADHFSEPTEHNNELRHTGYGYHGPPAPLDHEGRVIDTPDVAHARAAHFAAYEKAMSNIARAYPHVEFNEHNAPHGALKSEYNYHGPSAPLGKDGRVIDTPEVAHAKVAHFAAYSNAAYNYPRYSHYDTYSQHY